MDLSFSPDQAILRDRVSDFCTRHGTPDQEAERDRNPRFPDDLHRALAAAGFLGHCLPKEYGGSGGGALDMCVMHEGLSRFSATASAILFVNGICGALIALAGSPQQKREVLPAISTGDAKLAFALTEPGAGSDAAAIQARAVRDGDGYTIDGTKLYTTGAREADLVLTVARSSIDCRASRGTSLFLVPRASTGLTITPLRKIAGNAVASCRVEYRGVRVPASALLGEEDMGWGVLMTGGALERLAVAAFALGSAQAILDEVLAHVSTREQYGQSIAGFQAIQHQVADIATEIEAMRWLTYGAAWKTDQGLMPAKEISMAKLYASERLNEISMQGMRLLGGLAYLDGTPMPRKQREAMLSYYAGGTVEIQRNIIARALGLPSPKQDR